MAFTKEFVRGLGEVGLVVRGKLGWLRWSWGIGWVGAGCDGVEGGVDCGCGFGVLGMCCSVLGSGGFQDQIYLDALIWR